MIQVLKQYLTGGFCGFDREGSPIRVELFGYLDMKVFHDGQKKKNFLMRSNTRVFTGSDSNGAAPFY